MTKRRLFFAALALVLILAFITPALIYRIQFEQSTKVYTAAIDVTRLAKFFNIDQLPAVLEDYKKAGATTAVILEHKGQYREDHIKAADDAGYNIALIPDFTVKSEADLSRLCEQYNVKYLKLQNSIWKEKKEVPGKNTHIINAIKKYNLTLVLTETITQLSNDKSESYDMYLEAADGNILRTFNTYNITNVDKMDYPAVYYQMYNSAYDRNTRFITVKQLDDEGFTSEENAKRTQENVKLFCQKMESHGFVNEGTVDYNKYNPPTRTTHAAAAAIAVLMFALMVDLLFKDKIRNFGVIALLTASIAFAVSFIMPQALLSLYPTLFATISCCFCILIAALFVKNYKDKFSFVPLFLLTAAISIALLIVCAITVAALMSGPDWFLNNLVFRGVKVTLIAPMLFTAALVLATVYKRQSFDELKMIIYSKIKGLRWFHFVLFAFLAIVAGIYILRSGNVNRISFFETNVRNWLTEHFVARPRTKEIILGWPCLALYIYYVKKDKAKLLQWIFAIGASILFASTVNTFCHSFTLVETMLLRTVNGMVFGLPITAIVLVINNIIFKVFNKSRQYSEIY